MTWAPAATRRCWWILKGVSTVSVSSRTRLIIRARAGEQAQRLMRKFLGSRVFALIAGAVLCGKDGMPKLLWLKSQEPDTYNRMCCFLDVAGYLLYRSTGNMVMEWSGASVFGLDLKKKTWMEGIFRYVGLDEGHCYLGISGWVGVVTKRTPRGKCGAATVQSADPDKTFLFAETEAAGGCIQWIADQF